MNPEQIANKLDAVTTKIYRAMIVQDEIIEGLTALSDLIDETGWQFRSNKGQLLPLVTRYNQVIYDLTKKFEISQAEYKDLAIMGIEATDLLGEINSAMHQGFDGARHSRRF